MVARWSPIIQNEKLDFADSMTAEFVVEDIVQFDRAEHPSILTAFAKSGIKSYAHAKLSKALYLFFQEETETAQKAACEEAGIVYVAGTEQFLFRDGRGHYDLEMPFSENAARRILVGRRMASPKVAGSLLKDVAHEVVDTLEFAPGRPEIFENQQGRRCLNIYRPSEVKPVPGIWPTIVAIWMVVTNHDFDGALWLFNWAASKIQQPAVRGFTAPIFNGPPGVGKTLLGEMLGQCIGSFALISGEELRDNFNSQYVTKPLVVANEVSVGSDVLEMSEKLKPYLTDAYVPLKTPHAKRVSIKNTMSFWFTTNKTASIKIEKGDRRYSVFSIPDDAATPAQAALCDSLFDEKTKELNAKGLAERAAFLHDLMTFDVDWSAAKKPYNSIAKVERQAASRQAHEVFFDKLEEGGFEELKQDYLETFDDGGNDPNGSLRASSDRGAEALKFSQKLPDGVECKQVYRVYAHFAKTLASSRPLADHRFGEEWKRRYGATWPRGRTGTGRRPWVYKGFDGNSPPPAPPPVKLLPAPQGLHSAIPIDAIDTGCSWPDDRVPEDWELTDWSGDVTAEVPEELELAAWAEPLEG